MILIYLCAGRGSRLPKIFRTRPKCLVKIRNKTIFERNKNFFEFFKKKIIITGYKGNYLQALSRKFNFEIIHNQNYRQTNMVYSMFLANKKINDNVVICYGDIIFDYKIIKLLRSKKNILPVYSKWHTYWKKRMNSNKILTDAENLILKKDRVITIGGRILKKIPKYQFTGIIKLKKNKFKELNKFFKSFKKNIDMTSFLDICIKKRKLELYTKKYHNFWHEIDTKKDIIVAENSKEFY
tara:strand:+ start:19901 stop:20617 length:717 start_codon:yes stop_codon:yes gene_type:complete